VERQSPGHGRIAALFTAGFGALVIVLSVLDYYGLPEPILASILAMLLAGLLALSLNAGTLQASEFYLAGRAIPAGENGVVTAAATISAFVFLGLAGATYDDGASAAALTMGLALGFLASAALVAPYVRKSSAFGIADFFGIRYGGRWVRIAGAIAVCVVCLPGLAAALAAATFALTLMTGINAGVALWIVIVMVLAATVLGGLRALTRTALAEYGVMAIAMIGPAAAVAWAEYTWPVPFLTVGAATKSASLLALAGGHDLAAGGVSSFAPAVGGFSAVVALIVLAAAIPALPQLLMRSAAVRGANRARWSAGWALLSVLIIALTAPAYPAFARLYILREIAGSPIEQLPDWVFTFGQFGLVKLCGVAARSVNDVLGACSAQAGFTGNVDPAQLSIAGDGVLLAAPAITDLPFVASALVAAGALVACLAAAKAAAFAIAAAIGHDLYAGALDAHASAGRQLIVTRLATAVAVLVAAVIAAVTGFGGFGLASAMLALAAATLAAPLVLGIWWKRANAYGAICGMITGGVVTAVLIAEIRFPGFLPFAKLGLNELTAGIVGLPLSFAATVGGSLATEPPPPERATIVDAIRRPGGAPFVQEAESL
jgi:cation/acetate symporter